MELPQSPSSEPPVSISPGIRATKLLQIFNDALGHTLKTCSYRNFAECFPTPAKHVPDSLDGLHRDFIRRLGDVCKNEFAALIEDRAVIANLNELDLLIDEARKRKKPSDNSANRDSNGEVGSMSSEVPQHLISAQALLSAHVKPFVSARIDILGLKVGDTQKSNSQLYEDLVKQRANILQLVHLLENTVLDIDHASRILH